MPFFEILLIVLILVVFFSYPSWSYVKNRGWGYKPFSILLVVLLIFIILMMLRVVPHRF